MVKTMDVHGRSHIPLSLATDLTDETLGARGLWLGTRTGTGGTATLTESFFGRSPWLHGQQAEATFHVSGRANTPNCLIWETENPHVSYELEKASPKQNVWCGVTSEKVYGYSFSRRRLFVPSIILT